MVTRRLAIDLFQKVEKLFGPMALRNPPNHLTVKDFQRCIQAGRAMALVVMGATFDLARAKLKLRLCAVQGLDLRLLIHGQHQRAIRRIEIEANDIEYLFGKVRIVADFESF